MSDEVADVPGAAGGAIGTADVPVADIATFMDSFARYGDETEISTVSELRATLPVMSRDEVYLGDNIL